MKKNLTSIVVALLVICFASMVCASEPAAKLPAGHPPIGGQPPLPPGHPKVGDNAAKPVKKSKKSKKAKKSVKKQDAANAETPVSTK